MNSLTLPSFYRGLSSCLVCAILASFLLRQSLSAQETGSGENLADWTATDGEVAVDEETGNLSLPKGAQLYRHYTADQVIARLATRPYFSDVPADWAALEVGPASLTFIRNVDGGGMVLLADEPLELPFALELDEAGRSKLLLEFTLSYDQTQARAELSIEDVLFEIDATAPAGSIEVALSSGGSQDWTLESFEVFSDEEAQIATRSSSTNQQGDSNAPSSKPARAVALSGDRSALRAAAAVGSRALFMQDKDLEGERALTNANRNPRNSAEWHLETANGLVRAAYSIMREGYPEKAARIALRALEHAEKASRKAARKPGASILVATADQTAAFIQERLLADYEGAKRLYQRAAARHPLGDAQKRVRRIEAIEKEADRKSAHRTLSKEASQ